MAVGTPCVATDVTGIPEAIRDGETGFVVPQHDPEALAAACERLLEDPILRVEIATRARRLAETEFDVRRNAAALRELFLSVQRVRQEVAQGVA
jgi:glycosyltransferase involved in cell wall biosynthesis